MTRVWPIVNPQLAAYLETLGLVRDRDFLVSEPIPVTLRRPKCGTPTGRQLPRVRKDWRYKR